MNSLQLIIKQKYLNEILTGEKTEETREITPKTAPKYCNLSDSGDFESLKKFDKLILHAGYSANRATVEVEVLGEELEILQDEDDNDITYMHEGDEMVMCNVVYKLGRVLKKVNC